MPVLHGIDARRAPGGNQRAHQGGRQDVRQYHRPDGSVPVPFDCGHSSEAWAQAYLLRPTAPLGWLAVAVNLGVAATWAISRTVGLPIGATPGVPAEVGALDLLATAYEIALVVALLRVVGLARADAGEDEAYVGRVVRALWASGALVILLGLAGGVLVKLKKPSQERRADQARQRGEFVRGDRPDNRRCRNPADQPDSTCDRGQRAAG